MDGHDGYGAPADGYTIAALFDENERLRAELSELREAAQLTLEAICKQPVWDTTDSTYGDLLRAALTRTKGEE